MSKSNDKWVKCVTMGGSVKAVGVNLGDVVREAIKRHNLSDRPAEALGELLVASVLLAAYAKGEERINLKIKSFGEISQAFGDAYPDGRVRGYIILDPKFKPNEPKKKSDSEEERGPWDDGIMSVLRAKGPSDQNPYTGTVPLATGHLAKDLTIYWAQSEQVPSAVGIEVSVAGDQVKHACGFLVQALPNADPQDIAKIETNINNFTNLKEFLDDDSQEPTALLTQILQDDGFSIVEEKPLRFECNCSRERVEAALALVGTDELKDIIEDDGIAEVECEFCAEKYQIEKERLQEIVAAAKSK